MCDPVSIGIGIAVGAATGAATSAITGQDVGKGALMGGLMGGATAGIGGLGAGSFSSTVGGQLGASTSTSFINAVGSSVTQAGVAGLAATTAAGGLLMGALAPPKFDTPATTARQTSVQSQIAQLNSQQIATTGSGGSSAKLSLTEAIRRAKKRSLTQQDVADLSVDTSSFASTGLQIA